MDTKRGPTRSTGDAAAHCASPHLLACSSPKRLTAVTLATTYSRRIMLHSLNKNYGIFFVSFYELTRDKTRKCPKNNKRTPATASTAWLIPEMVTSQPQAFLFASAFPPLPSLRQRLNIATTTQHPRRRAAHLPFQFSNTKRNTALGNTNKMFRNLPTNVQPQCATRNPHTNHVRNTAYDTHTGELC